MRAPSKIEMHEIDGEVVEYEITSPNTYLPPLDPDRLDNISIFGGQEIIELGQWDEFDRRQNYIMLTYDMAENLLSLLDMFLMEREDEASSS